MERRNQHNMDLRILCLEDSPDDAGLIAHVLRKNGLDFRARVVDTRDEFETALGEFEPHVILSDHALPQFNSLAALQIVRTLGMRVPFILVTGTVSEEFAVNCLKHGADDYILKSHLARLPSAIINALERRQTESSRERAERALRTQNEELVKVNHELDRFVYSVSHNLRAPLMSILGLIHLSRYDHPEPDSLLGSYFEKMEDAIRRLDDTLKEILDYSRNARIEIDRSWIHTHELLPELIDGLKYLAGFDKIDFRLNIDEDCRIFSDPDRLKVILNNILCNSIKYRDPRKVVSFVRVDAIATTSGLTMRIADNGIGIEEDVQPRIFDMFFRGTEASDGAGLGLYIVKETVRRLNGTLDLQSRPGEGCTITLQLPHLRPPDKDETVGS